MASERTADRAQARSIANPVAVIVVCAIGLTCLGLTILFSASVSLEAGPLLLPGQAAGGGRGRRLPLLCREPHQPRLCAARLGLDRGDRPPPRPVVLIPHLGVTVKGSRRWLGYGALRLQVSEFAKLAMVFCLAHYLALNQTRIGDLKRGYLYPLANHQGLRGAHPP